MPWGQKWPHPMIHMFNIDLYRENIKKSCLKPLVIDIMYVASSSDVYSVCSNFASESQKLPHPCFTVNPEFFVRIFIFANSGKRHICNIKNPRLGHD